MSKILIDPKDPDRSIEAWENKRVLAQKRAEMNYRNAVLKGEDGYKIGFFEAVKEAREIESAIKAYTGQGTEGIT
jgi:hypothetical protein